MNSYSDQVDQLKRSGVFDEARYVQRYPDVLQCAMSPAEHYVRIGQYIGRSPCPEPVVQQAPEQRSAPSRASGFNVDAPIPAKTYTQYSSEIFSKISSLPARQPHPDHVDIDTDFTGPPHASPFDSFISKRQRTESAKQIERMLSLGVVAINPRPGLHAARNKEGDFISYNSISAQNCTVNSIPSNVIFHIHAFYPDVVEEILSYFSDDAKNGKFFVTTTTKKNHSEISQIFSDRGFRNFKVLLINNKGRDIGPFLDYALDHASEGDVICHIHTKKSPDVGGNYGEKWRNQLYGALLNQTAIDAFQDSELGLLFPETSRSVGWGKNLPYCRQIADRLGREVGIHPGPLPVGNMFFARTQVIQAMRKATHGFEWPREPVPYDGTILHAIERMWSMASDHAGLKWAAILGPALDLDEKA